MKITTLNEIKLDLSESEDLLAVKAAKILGISINDIIAIDIIKKALDARRHKPPHFVYAIRVRVSDNTKLPYESEQDLILQRKENVKKSSTPSLISALKFPVVVIGSGPAGLFAAYVLALRNIPVIILERGLKVEERIKDVKKFWEKGVLNPRSNVLFGEGGAGTFSDGKLTSRTKSPFSLWVKNILVQMGAPSTIVYDAKPHIGTDQLRRIIINLRNTLIEMGCRIEFNAEVTDFLIFKRRITAVVINKEKEIETNNVILAIGQSADETYRMLFKRGIKLEDKPFAMGLRVEHPQELINSIQYGKWHNHPQLPPAEYFITASVPDLNRSVYTFCMCPGGSVIGCAASDGLIITNGMSDSTRSGKFANSAIVVNIRVADFVSHNQNLSGLEFRQIWEKEAFLAGGSNYFAPAQRMTDFLQAKKGGNVGKTSFLPGVRSAELDNLLPKFVINSLKQGIKEFNRKMPGFITEEAHLIGVETRTSSPLRISRCSDGQSETVFGIYPCGEGAGYAGGIISSALDGIKAAHNLIKNLES